MSKFRVIPAEHLPAQPAVLAIRHGPPSPSSEGMRYIVSATPSGGWVGHPHKIAWYMNGQWYYDQPESGWRCFVIDANKDYVYINGEWIPAPELAWGSDFEMQIGRHFYHRDLSGVDSVGDYRTSFVKNGLNGGYVNWIYNGNAWVPQNFYVRYGNLTPNNDIDVDLHQYLELIANALGESYEDKGVFLELEFQFWMNHYFNNSATSDIYHRSVTATKVLQLSVLKTADQSQHLIWQVSSLLEKAFTGTWVQYDSDPIMLYQVMNAGDLDPDPFDISVHQPGIHEVYLRVNNGLITVQGFEPGVEWDVSFVVRGRMIQYSDYDITQEII